MLEYQPLQVGKRNNDFPQFLIDLCMISWCARVSNLK